MAESLGGKPLTSIAEQLFAQPWQFEFFQAVRLLELIEQRGGGAPSTEPARFRTLLSLDTPASPIYQLDPGRIQKDGKSAATAEPMRTYESGRSVPDRSERHAPEMTVTFMGLTGSMGALPLHYTELLLERRFRHRDTTAQQFFDLFNHRLISLFYQSWRKYRFFVDYEQNQRDTFVRYLLDIVGLGTDGLRGRLGSTSRGMDDQALAYYAGLLAQKPHSAANLVAILSDYFSVPVRIEQFRGRSLQLRDDQCTVLGNANHKLGDEAMLGSEIWDQQSQFRVHLGPLGKRQYDDLLPSGAGFQALTGFIRFYAGPSLDFDVALSLKREDVPYCVLGITSTGGSQLGWSAWLKTGAFSDHAEGAVFVVGRNRKRWPPRTTNSLPNPVP